MYSRFSRKWTAKNFPPLSSSAAFRDFRSAPRKRKWACAAVPPSRSSSRIAACPAKTCCTKSAARYSKERTAFGHSISDFGLVRAKLAEIAIRTFALESMIYRTAGTIDQAMKAGATGGNKATHTMKVLEEYAIECSIAKVFGSEVLDYTVDEAVQIYGGYGFHEDYPVARGYRDSRVNRIFEGTNEINRMLIIQMLMKRALAGTLPLMAAGAKLQEEILSGSPVEDSPDGPWAEESRIVRGAKKVFLL